MHVPGLITRRLITGPPASGKSKAALEVFLSDPISTLLVPTATMAEHIRNEQARAGVSIRPNRILTLAKFIEPFTDLKDAPESLVHVLIAQRLPNEFPGYHRALAALMRELPNADIEDQLAESGYALHAKRLRSAHPVVTGPVVIDGFFTISKAEQEFIEKLAAQTSVTITLPQGSLPGFEEHRLEQPFRHPKQTTFAALSQEQEVEQIALRILERAAKGREFREMGIILRVRDPYAQALEAAFARFGIPARFHFADALSAHPVIQYLSGLIRTMLNGWDHAELLTYLRMPISPISDAEDFAMRESLPAAGLDSGRAANLGCSRLLSRLAELENNRRTPQDWSATLESLLPLLPAPEITDQVPHDQLQIWRSTTAALNAFSKALDITAQTLPETKIPLSRFWPHAETALSIEKLRVTDRRRDVVNIFDVYEARQWELPIVFVCGLTERHFPQYHREDSLLSDAARKEMGLPTSEDRQREEKFLFELALSRATEETILSYARFNDRGDAQLRSFFLAEEGSPSSSARIVPRKSSPFLTLDQKPVDLRKHYAKLAPTSIESFLQCPFQFFASKTLRLRQRPWKPRERLDVLLQGSILHKALAEYSRVPMFGVSWLDTVFEDECQRKKIPKTYRKEAVRLELLRHFEAFLADRQWPLNWQTTTEQKFVLPLTPELSINGRIDRLDRSGNQAIVIDYKYSASARIKQHLNTVQGGLYLLAAQQTFHLTPAGVFFCGLRQSVTWEGWHTSVPGLSLGEARKDLIEIIDEAKQKAIEAFETIASGNVDVRPADREKCRWCDFKDICRVESQAEKSATA